MRRFRGIKLIGLATVSWAALSASGALAQDATPLMFGEGVDASLVDEDARDALGQPYDAWALNLTAGQRIEVMMNSDDFDAYLELYGPDSDGSAPVSVDDDGAGEGTNARLRYTVPADGTYTLRARAFSEEARGTYNLIAHERPAPPPAPEPTALSLGQTVTGTIDDTDPVTDEDVPYEAWRFSAREGERILITLTSDDFDSFVQVGHAYTEVFEELAYNDDDGDSLNSRLIFTAPATGDYVVRARPLALDETGSYSLTVAEAPPPPQARSIRIGDEAEGSLTVDSALDEAGYRSDVYEFRGQEGQRVQIRLGSEDFDTYLVLYQGEEGGVPLSEDDDGGGQGTNSRIVSTLPADGLYRVEVRGFSQTAAGDYTLSVTEMAPERPPAPLAWGRVVQGAIDDQDPQDAEERGYDSFRFSGVEGNRVQIIARSGDFDTFLRLGSADGEFDALAQDDDGLGEGTDSRLNFTLPETGDYVVRVSPLSSGSEGLYSIELIDRGPAPTPGSILIGSTARGTLTETDAAAADNSYFDAYRINAKAGETLVITMISNSFDAFVIVGREKDGDDIEVLASDDDGLSDTHARLEWEVPDDGVYIIRAGSYAPGETGTYALKVERQP
ncbi:pre-peptidase C-terminal domain-containing protein [Brevundimonas sp. A19_0]|uniref:pre-peptidase C-terminal domain-containing protein n=1 Tax=Brevundimonas sp. A19_0 TaxID=2821087 RepID=UPI001ADA0337|nr:pre-peptidase C-terminal domain-containing protein [Brevundimonas sp. A19_0]MBO9502950.1 pre-peptidase C-terminal domain-containing protein [Brevundimonas sp. A19_0]